MARSPTLCVPADQPIASHVDCPRKAPSGGTESSAFQEHYPPEPPRRYYRPTAAGMAAPLAAWADPLATLLPRLASARRRPVGAQN